MKCKAWDKTNKEWVDYGFCLRFDVNGDYEVLNSFGKPFEDREIIPVQWSGETDKHGKDIYEGDFLSYEGQVLALVYRDGCSFKRSDGRFRFHLDECPTSLSEIVGSMYESTNLLDIYNMSQGNE